MISSLWNYRISCLSIIPVHFCLWFFSKLLGTTIRKQVVTNFCLIGTPFLQLLGAPSVFATLGIAVAERNYIFTERSLQVTVWDVCTGCRCDPFGSAEPAEVQGWFCCLRGMRLLPALSPASSSCAQSTKPWGTNSDVFLQGCLWAEERESSATGTCLLY